MQFTSNELAVAFAAYFNDMTNFSSYKQGVEVIYKLAEIKEPSTEESITNLLKSVVGIGPVLGDNMKFFVEKAIYWANKSNA